MLNDFEEFFDSEGRFKEGEPSFIRPYDNDPNFKYIPFRAAFVLERDKGRIRTARPFADYAISYYQKYDPESYDIAIEWNKKFTSGKIKNFNSFDRLIRQVKKDNK